MVKLFCVLVGLSDSAFSVDIDESDTVDDLKKAIKKEADLDIPAYKLRLFLAKRNNAWLEFQDPDVIALENGEIPDSITALMTEKMKAPLRIENQVHFGKNFEPSEGDIHVLVDTRESVSAVRNMVAQRQNVA